MKRLLPLLILALFGCSGGDKKADSTTVDESGIDCGSASSQKLITYCSSPQAAELAKKNLEIKNVTRFEEAFSPLPLGSSPSFGKKDALVTIVMFSDLQCPFCQEVHNQLKKITETKDVRVVFKHAPLPFHQDAVPAALAAIQANESGKFWEYVELAYSNQEALKGKDLKSYAEKVGLDVTAFEQNFGSPGHIEVIQNDINLARNTGVEATPTMFINGLRIVGLYPEDQLNQIIDREVAYAQKLVDAGVAKEDVHWRSVSVNYNAPEIVAEEPEPPQQTVVAMVPVVDAPSKGASSDDAFVTIVEFSDFECSYCRKAQVWLDEYMEQNGADIRLVYRHFPLPFHENADIAAAASIVAHQEGKFWEYHDRLFANQDKLTANDLVDHAKAVKLNRTKFKKLRQSDGVVELLKADVELAQALGVEGTPTFFVNGIMYVGVPVDEAFPALVESQRELGKKIAAETGLKGDALYEAIVKANQEAN